MYALVSRQLLSYLTAVWILSKCPLVQINWSKAICCYKVHFTFFFQLDPKKFNLFNVLNFLKNETFFNDFLSTVRCY